MAVSCGTVGGSSLNPNAPHSVPMLAQLFEDLRLALRKLQMLHEHREQEMADLLDSGFSEPPVPKNRTRPLSFRSKYREKPVERVRPKCSPRRIIHQPR